MRIAVMITLALVTSACAAGGAPGERASQYSALSEACSDRGGVLTPSLDQRLTGKGGAGYVCRVSGGATRIPPRATTAG